MEFWFQLDNTIEPMNNIHHVSSIKLDMSEEELAMVRSVFRLLTESFSKDNIIGR